MADTTITLTGGAAGSYTGNLISGTDDDDTLVGTSGNDIIVGGAGGADGDRIEGGEGDDVLIGGSLKEGNGANAGTYSITNAGGGPADTFVFNFTITETEGDTIYFRDGNTPNYTANQSAWDNYQSQLEAWRAQLADLYGDDLDLSTLSTDVYTSSTKSKPSTYVGTEEYDNSFTIGGGTTITSTDGNDTILDFQWGTDQLDLGALTKAQFLSHFSVADNGSATTISLDGGGWSVTILGVAGLDEAVWADYIFGV